MLNTISQLMACAVLLAGSSGCESARSNPVPERNVTADAIHADSVPAADPISALLTLDYVMGKFEPSSRPDFTEVDLKYADKEGMYLRKDAYEAFQQMYAAALKSGIQLQIRSATRNFSAQKTIWEGKWTGARLIEGGENLAESTPDPVERAKKILRFSSMPGSSRHHWGTDIDLNNLENSWFEEGEGAVTYNWLKENAPSFGYCQPYTAGRPYGYWEERWHWSYMPVSKRLTEFARHELKNEMIVGFPGAETAVPIDIVHKYVLGISDDCVK